MNVRVGKSGRDGSAAEIDDFCVGCGLAKPRYVTRRPYTAVFNQKRIAATARIQRMNGGGRKYGSVHFPVVRNSYVMRARSAIITYGSLSIRQE